MKSSRANQNFALMFSKWNYFTFPNNLFVNFYEKACWCFGIMLNWKKEFGDNWYPDNTVSSDAWTLSIFPFIRSFKISLNSVVLFQCIGLVYNFLIICKNSYNMYSKFIEFQKKVSYLLSKCLYKVTGRLDTRCK